MGAHFAFLVFSFCLQRVTVAQAPPDHLFIELLQAFSKEEVKQRNFDDLREFVAIQSVSADPSRHGEVLKAADWLARRMQSAGVQKVEVMSTSGPQPIVYGEFMHPHGDNSGRKRPTVMIYGHFDVQPEDPVESWTYPPFEMTYNETEHYIYGRGVDDDKGCLLQALHAFEMMKHMSFDTLPNIRFLFEGQEEVMSANLRQFLQDHKDTLLPTDVVLSADGRQVSHTEGGLVLSMRGVVGLEVEVVTANADVHSGRFGGSIPNAAVTLAKIVAQLHDDETGAVAVPGFYKGVQEPDDLHLKEINDLKFKEAEERTALGIKAWHGESSYDTIERRWHRPSLEIVGMSSGFTGEGMKTIVPHRATAKISCRLVPGQQPDDIYEKIAAYVKKITPRYATANTVRLGGSADPWVSPRESYGNLMASAVLQQLMGKPPLYVRDGATIPALAAFQSVLGLQTTPFGWGLGENIHAPNERLKSAMWHKGHTAWALLLHKLGQSSAPPGVGGSPTSSKDDRGSQNARKSSKEEL